MIDALRFAPKGTTTWLMERDKRPAIAKLRENRTRVREVAEELIEHKRQELKSGNPQKDILSVLGLS